MWSHTGVKSTRESDPGETAPAAESTHLVSWGGVDDRFRFFGYIEGGVCRLIEQSNSRTVASPLSTSRPPRLVPGTLS